MVRVRDKIRMMEMLWQPVEFMNWFHRMRNCDIKDSVKELQELKCDWERYDETEVFEDSLNCSRISINMTPVKKRLNESVHHLSMDASMMDMTLTDQTFVTSHDQQENVNACLTQIEVAAKTLNKLCHRYGSHDTKSVIESLTKMQDIVKILKDKFQIKDLSESEDMNTSSINSADNTVIDMSNDIRCVLRKDLTECKEKSTNSVDNNGKSEIDDKENTEDDKDNLSHNMTKSNLRSGNAMSETKIGNVQKSVRFFDKTNLQ